MYIVYVIVCLYVLSSVLVYVYVFVERHTSDLWAVRNPP